jgi:hypothetical protein
MGEVSDILPAIDQGDPSAVEQLSLQKNKPMT